MRISLLSFGLLAVLGIGAWAQTGQNRGPQTPDFDKVEIHTLPVQGNVYMLIGAGGNVTLQAGKDGVLLVDTEYAEMTDKLVAAIRNISNGPIRYIINTLVHGDHTGGNDKIVKLGSIIAAGHVAG